MKGENEKPKEPEVYYYIKCPKCGIKAVIDRSFCVCGEYLHLANGVYKDPIKPVLIDKVNVDYPYYSCEKCGANCNYCASFSALKANTQGWGGKDCKHKQDHIKCTCCQLIIKNFGKYESIDQGVKESIEAIQRILENRNRKVA